MSLPQQRTNGLQQSHSNPLLSASRSPLPETILSRSRSTTLLQSELTDVGPSSVLSRLALLRADLKLRNAQTILDSIKPTRTTTRDATLNTLRSMPLIEELLDMMCLPHETEKPLSEATVLSAVAALAKQPSSPWSSLLLAMPNSPLVGVRTQEQYMAAVNLSAKARREARHSRKMAKYWKNVSRDLLAKSGGEGTVCVVSPSPSDISDTGLDEPFSSLRQQNVETLAKKRASSCSLMWKPVKNLSNYPIQQVLLRSVDEELCQDEQTLVNIDTHFTPLSKAKEIPCNKESKTVQDVLTIQVPKITPEKSKKYSFLKREHKIPRSLSRLTKSASGRRISSLPTVSVQAKRNVYETLASNKGSPISPLSKRPGQTSRCAKYDPCNLTAIESPITANPSQIINPLSAAAKPGTQFEQEQKVPSRLPPGLESRALSRASVTRK